MKSVLIALVLILALSGCQKAETASPPGAKVISQEVVDERTDKLVIESPATGGQRSVWVMKPTGWTAGSNGWRALYMLHGCCADGGWDWLKSGEVKQLTAGLNAVVIVPEGGPMGWYTNWKSGPAWETFHMTEVRGLVESRYGVGNRRSIVGFSMGGHGAFAYAERHPGVFEAAASLSGVLDIREDVTGYQAFFKSYGLNTDDVWGDVTTWSAYNPTDQVAKLKGMRLYASCGDGDPGPLDSSLAPRDTTEAGLFRQNKNFAAAAEKAGVAVTTDFYGNGTHTWPYWIQSLERALPLLLP